MNRLCNLAVWLALAAQLASGRAGALAAPGFELAFGSCLRQWQAQPVWDGILAAGPDLLLLLGDNVYTDTGPYLLRREPQRITEAYRELAADPGFRRLREQVPVLATWDDHDYGANNAGAEYPYKLQAKQAFVDFFAIPGDSPLYRRDGIYQDATHDTPAGRVQLLLLDTRSFRSPLRYGDTDAACPRSRILPNDDPGASVLGETQWAWLRDRLAEPADLRIVASSIQVIPDAHCFEKWANFPHERNRLFAALGAANGGHVVVLSGDRHLGEMSRVELPGGSMLYEVTASGLNSAGAGRGEANRYRLHDDNVRVDHFGMLRASRDAAGLQLVLELRDVAGQLVQHFEIPAAP